MQALVEQTGSERIFGLSSGAIIALEAARVAPPPSAFVCTAFSETDPGGAGGAEPVLGPELR